MAQSFLITSKDSQKIENKIQEIYRENQIGVFDQTVVQGDIGIEEVRNLKKNIFLAPLKSPCKAVTLRVDTITIEAQNALLKLLEEPPPNTIMILTARTIELFLSTILSRCTIIEFREDWNTLSELSEGQMLEYTNTLAHWQNNSIGALLTIAQNNSKSREDTLGFLEQTILVARKTMLEKSDERQRLIKAIRSLQKTYTVVKTTNVTPRLALENLFVSL